MSSAASEFALFYESDPGHSYLYDLYADSVPSRLVTIRHRSRDRSPAGVALNVAHLERLFGEARDLDAATVMTTLDPFAQAPLLEVIARAATLNRRPIVAILHRPSNWPQGVAGPSDPTGNFRVCVLAEELVERTRATLGFTPHVLPHHPTSLLIPPKPARRSSGRVVVSMLGEFRTGKGLDLVLDAIGLFGPHLSSAVHLVFGGGATEAARARIERVVAASGATADLWLRPLGGIDYDVLSDIEFADLVHKTDIGLLLYQDEQREAMSGVLPNFVATDAVVIGTRNSVVGEIIDRYRLGTTVEDEEPVALRDAIAHLMDPAVRSAHVRSPAYEAYRRFTSPDNARRTLRKLLDLAVAA